METLSRLVFTFLLNALWQVILVTALTAIAVRLLQRTPARYRHALWVMGLALAVLLPITTVPKSCMLARKATSASEMTSPPQSPQAIGPRAELGQSIAAGTSGKENAPGHSLSLLLNPFRQHTRSIALSPFFLYAAFSVYIFSLLCQITRLAWAWTSARQFRRKAGPCQLPEGVASLVMQCQAELGLGPVALHASAQVAGPATVGFFKPVIVLPEKLFQDASPEELTSALCHEMAHVRRRDYLLNLICEFVFLPLAFHPAAWLLKRRIDETRELACDEAAAGRLLGPVAYARSLVSLARSIAPSASTLRPRYILGVFDTNILEERIMRLLDKRPQISPPRARLLLGGTTLALVLAALAAGMFSLSAAGNAKAAGTPAPSADFSGRWELDKSQSELPSPAPDNLVEVIDQHGSELRVTTTSKDWNAGKPIAVTLFALMLPEFSTTTDSKETIQTFGPGQMRSKTHWDHSNLVTDWTLERNGQVAVTGRWIRRLSEDGKTQTVEITGHDPVHNLDGEAKAVFVRREQDPQAFLGTWRGQFEGKTYILLSLKEVDGTMNGAVSVGGFRINDSGQVARVNEEANPRDVVPISDAKLEGDLLSFKGTTPDGGSVVTFQMKLAGDSAAELKCRVLDAHAGTPEPGWWKLVRQSNVHQATHHGPGPLGGVEGGVTGGIVGGTPGGVMARAIQGGIASGAVVGGVQGGVVGGVASSAVGGGVQGGVVGGIVGGVVACSPDPVF